VTAGDPSDASLRPLSIDECWELLATVPVGRVAVAVEGEAPLVVPVNHLVEGRTILLRSGAGTKLDAARRQPIAFQADAYDPHLHQGWSVLVRGMASIEGPSGSDPEPWAGGHGRKIVVRIWPEHVTGRVVAPGELSWDPKGYL
jgi:hypothetical protein